jgi:hypothetical protein
MMARMNHASPSHAPVCGFSFGRNLSKLNYPAEAAVRSVLPVCDHFVFAVGQSDDDTAARVAAIDPKVQVIPTQWPDVKVDGQVLAIEANKAMAAAQAIARDHGCIWGFYIQADEVVHEDDLSRLRAAMDHWADEPQVKALLFAFLHFVLDYQTVDPWMYHKASRIVRLDDSCEIVGDACGPGIKNYTGKVHGGNGYLDKHHLGEHVRWAADPRQPGGDKARIFHYGWVKSRKELDEKFRNVEKLWWGTLSEEDKQQRKQNKFGRFLDRYPILKKYRATHPALMANYINQHPPLAATVNRWLNPRFYGEMLRHGFHG